MGHSLHPDGAFSVERFLSKPGVGKAILPFHKGTVVFSQGDPSSSLFYIREGMVKLTVLSGFGKEATIALLNPKDFVGEECISQHEKFRSVTATALTDCLLLRIHQKEMKQALQDESSLANLFLEYVLTRTSRIQADLIDQLFNSTERRLARTLLLLAHFGERGVLETLVPPISQVTLAAMIGCTRSRVNFFLNRFRRLGYIEYDDRIKVHNSLLQVLLHDQERMMTSGEGWRTSQAWRGAAPCTKI